MHDLILGKTYENTDLNLNIDESSRRLMERQLNPSDKNSYEQIHIDSSAENMCTYEDLFAKPINDTECITFTTDKEVCFMMIFGSNALLLIQNVYAFSQA